MAFIQNHEEASNTSDLKPEGDYEVIIKRIEEKTTRNGAVGLNFYLIIRNDVSGQKYGNAYLFYTIWKAKNPTAQDNLVDGYNFGQVMAIGKAARLPDKKQYKDLEEYCNDLINKCVVATVKHDEYNGVINEKVKRLSETKHPDCKHVFKDKTAAPVPAQTSQTYNSFAGESAYTSVDNNEDDDYPF